MLAVPSEERELVRYYTLSADELEFVRRRRRPHNRLGLAVQIAYMRYPGIALPSIPDVDPRLSAFVAAQVGVAPQELELYGQREMTRLNHAAEVRTLLGVRQSTAEDRDELKDWLFPVALRIDNGFLLALALVEEMRRRALVIPGVDVIDNLGAAVRTRGRNAIHLHLTSTVSAPLGAELDELLDVRGASSKSTWSWLLQPPGRSSPNAMHAHLDRLQLIRSFKLNQQLREGVYHARFAKIARAGRRTTSNNLKKFGELRRRATIVSTLLDLETRVTDEIVGMADLLLASVFRKGGLRRKQTLDDAAGALHEKMQLLTRLGESLLRAKGQGEDLEDAVEEVVPWADLAELVADAKELTGKTSPSALPYLDSWYSYLRQYAPRLLDTLEFGCGPAAEAVVGAVHILRELNARGGRAVPHDAPTDFISNRWDELVFPESGKTDRHFYEIATLAGLRDGLRSGDIWVSNSNRYRAFDDYLVSEDKYCAILASEPRPLAVDLDFESYIGGRVQQLRGRLTEVDSAMQNGLDGVSLERGQLRIAPNSSAVPDDASGAVRTAYAALPDVRITDLLVEVDEWTNFSRHFEHLSSGELAKDREALFAAILGDALNLGLTRMARSSPRVSLSRMSWTSDWHIREETYELAIAEIINAHHRHPMSKHWGDGTTSSSDGQAFRVGSHGKKRGRLNAQYGRDPVTMLYGFVSDQYGLWKLLVTNPHDRDATNVLDGLIHHETDLQIAEHYTDTAGFTDHTFALFHLYGVRFAPRIRDLGDKRLCRLPGLRLPALEPLVGQKPIDIEIIRQHWTEVLRLAVSIREASVPPSLILKKLAGRTRRGGVSRTLQELGKIERTLYTLDWLESPDLRQRVSRGLNKGEAENALKKAIFMHRLGEFRDRSFEDQQRRASGLNLAVAAIVMWNTCYLWKAVTALGIPVEHVEHISPIGWGHINLAGDYVWERLAGRT